jgi:hypothetical protein
VAEVGSRDNAVGETCIAILETPNWYLLCTSSRGVVTGVPVFIGLPHTVIEFDP